MFLFEDSQDKVIRLEVDKLLEICSTNPNNPRKYNEAMEKIMVHIKKNDQKVIEQTVGFIKETIKNTDYQPVRKFQAIVLLKDLMKSNNKALGKYVVKKILKRLTIFAAHKAHTPQSKDENRGKDIFGRVNKDQQLYSIRFLNTLLSAIEEWSKNWPKAPDGPSQDFHEAYNDLLLSKIQFPQEVPKQMIKSAPPRPSKAPIPVSPSKSFIKDGDTQKHFTQITESAQMMNQILTEGQNYQQTWPIVESVVASTISLLQKGDEYLIRVGDMPDSYKPKAQLKKKLDCTFDFLEALTADSKVVGKRSAQYPTFRTKYIKLTKKLIADLKQKQTPREAKEQSKTPPKVSRKWDGEEDNEPKIKGANRYDSTKGLRLEIDGKKQEQFGSGNVPNQKLHGTQVGMERKKFGASQELDKMEENEHTAKVVSSSAFHIKDIKPKQSELKVSSGSMASDDSNEARTRKKKTATFSNEQPKVKQYVREEIKKAPIAPSKELQSSMRSNGSKSEINIFKDMEAKQKSQMPVNLVQIDNRRKNNHKPAEAENMFQSHGKDASMTLGLDAFNQTKQSSESDRNASHVLGLNSATQMSKKNSINVSAFGILHKPSPFSIPKLASDSAFIPMESLSQIAAKNKKNNQTFDPFAQNSSVHSATNPFDNDSVASMTKKKNNPFADDNQSLHNIISMERLSPTKTEDISQRKSFKQIQNGEFKKKMGADGFAEQFDNTVQHRQKLQQLIGNNPFSSSFKLQTHEDEEESARGFQFDDFANPSKAEILNNKSNTQIPVPSAFNISDFNKVTKTRIDYQKSAIGISDIKNGQSNRTVQKRAPSFENVLSNGEINGENPHKSGLAFSDFGEPTTSKVIPQQKSSNQSQFGVRFSEFPSANNSQVNPSNQGLNFQSFLSQKQSQKNKSGVDFNTFFDVGMAQSKQFNPQNDPYSSFTGQPPKGSIVKQSKNQVRFSQFGNPSSFEQPPSDFFQNVPITNRSNVLQKQQSVNEFDLSDFQKISKKSKSQNDSMWNKFENISGKQLQNSFNPNEMIANSNFFVNPKAVQNAPFQKKPTNIVTNEKELFANNSGYSEKSSSSKQIKKEFDSRLPQLVRDLKSVSSKGRANPEKNQAVLNFLGEEMNFKKKKQAEVLFDAKSLSSIGQTKPELMIVGLKQQDIFEEFQHKMAKKSGTFVWEPIISPSNVLKPLHINSKQLPSIRSILEERKKEYDIQMKDLANLKNKQGEVRQRYLQIVEKVESAKTQANQYSDILRKIKFGNELKERQILQIQQKIKAVTANKREILQKQRLLQEIIHSQSLNVDRKSQMSRTKVEKWEMFNKNMQQYRNSAANITNTASNFY